MSTSYFLPKHDQYTYEYHSTYQQETPSIPSKTSYTKEAPKKINSKIYKENILKIDDEIQQLKQKIHRVESCKPSEHCTQTTPKLIPQLKQTPYFSRFHFQIISNGCSIYENEQLRRYWYEASQQVTEKERIIQDLLKDLNWLERNWLYYQENQEDINAWKHKLGEAEYYILEIEKENKRWKKDNQIWYSWIGDNKSNDDCDYSYHDRKRNAFSEDKPRTRTRRRRTPEKDNNNININNDNDNENDASKSRFRERTPWNSALVSTCFKPNSMEDKEKNAWLDKYSNSDGGEITNDYGKNTTIRDENEIPLSRLGYGIQGEKVNNNFIKPPPIATTGDWYQTNYSKWNTLANENPSTSNRYNKDLNVYTVVSKGQKINSTESNAEQSSTDRDINTTIKKTEPNTAFPLQYPFSSGINTQPNITTNNNTWTEASLGKGDEHKIQQEKHSPEDDQAKATDVKSIIKDKIEEENTSSISEELFSNKANNDDIDKTCQIEKNNSTLTQTQIRYTINGAAKPKASTWLSKLKYTHKTIKTTVDTDLNPNNLWFTIYDSKSILCFNMESRKFSLIEFADFSDFNSNYLPGGSWHLTTPSKLFIITGENFDLFYMFSFEKKSISKLSRLTNNHSFGGWIQMNSNYLFCLSGAFNKNVERYDIRNNKWEFCPNMMTIERSECSYVIYNKKTIFAFFGYNSPQQIYWDSIEFCDISDDWAQMKWKNVNCVKNKSNVLLDIKAATMFQINQTENRFVIWGGFNGQSNKGVECYLEVFICEANDEYAVEIKDTKRKIFDWVKNKEYFFNNSTNVVRFKECNVGVYDKEMNVHFWNRNNMLHDIFYFEK